MTEEIRKSIREIPISQRGQHDRIKKALVMLCDEIDKLQSAKQPTNTVTTKKVEVKK